MTILGAHIHQQKGPVTKKDALLLGRNISPVTQNNWNSAVEWVTYKMSHIPLYQRKLLSTLVATTEIFNKWSHAEEWTQITQLRYNEIGDKTTQSGNDTHLSKTVTHSSKGKMAIPKMSRKR